MVKRIFSLLKEHPLQAGAGVFLFFALCSLLTGNLLSLNHSCFDVYDLGIYHQAIVELGVDNPNPYLTVRGLKVFNDHFDPVLFLAAFFVHLFDNALEATIVFEFLWYLAFLFFLAMAVAGKNIGVKKEQMAKMVLLVIFMAVFTRGMLTGVLFPVHPTFWSIIPLFFICKYVKQQNFKGIFLSSLALCFFKEIFAPALIFFSLYYAFRKNWKFFFPLFFLGISCCVFVFHLRPLWMGSTFAWGEHVFSKNPFEKLFVRALLQGNYSSVFRLLYPFIIPFFLLYKKEIKKEGFKHFSIPVFFLITPLFGLHFINRELWFQYGSTTVGPLLSIIALSSVPGTIINNRKLLLFTCLLFFINGLNRYRTQWGIAIRVLEDFMRTNHMERLIGSYDRCFLTGKHRHATREVREFIRQTSPDKKILATGGIIPRIISPGRLIYALGGHSEIQSRYDILLFEKNDSDNYTYRMQKKRTTKARAACGGFIKKIHMDNDFYYLAEGKFPSSCL